MDQESRWCSMFKSLDKKRIPLAATTIFHQAVVLIDNEGPEYFLFVIVWLFFCIIGFHIKEVVYIT